MFVIDLMIDLMIDLIDLMIDLMIDLTSFVCFENLFVVASHCHSQLEFVVGRKLCKCELKNRCLRLPT